MQRLAISSVVAVSLGLGCGSPQQASPGDALADSIRARANLRVLSISRSAGRLDIVVVADSPTANPDVEFANYAEAAKKVWPLLSTTLPETLVFVAERGAQEGRERSAYFYYRSR